MFVHLPGLSQSSLKKIINSLTECGAGFSEFFHKKITHLITSNRCLELARDKSSTSKKILTDPSSRGAMILARTTKARFKRRTLHVPNLIPIWVDPNN